jgi:hypothetical protein
MSVALDLIKADTRLVLYKLISSSTVLAFLVSSYQVPGSHILPPPRLPKGGCMGQLRPARDSMASAEVVLPYLAVLKGIVQRILRGVNNKLK